MAGKKSSVLCLFCTVKKILKLPHREATKYCRPDRFTSTHGSFFQGERGYYGLCMNPLCLLLYDLSSQFLAIKKISETQCDAYHGVERVPIACISLFYQQYCLHRVPEF